MDETYFRKITTTVIISVLIVLSFFLLRPILFSIIIGFLLTFIFYPVYNLLYKKTKSKNFSTIIICAFLLALIIVPLWFFTPKIIDESIKLYRISQQLDIVSSMKKIFPSLFASAEFSQEISSIIQSFITKLTNSIMNYFSEIILNFPTLILQLFVIFFIFFYSLRDNDQIIGYIKSLLPFSKEVEKKLFESTKDITFSILYGQVIIGVVQGIILGLGFFIFRVPNAFLLTGTGILAGILPIIGPAIVGIPVAIYLILGGNSFAAFGILALTLISSFADNLLRPFIVSRRTRIHTGLLLTGMIGGFLLFGLLGIILGPLILAYLVTIIEIYRNKSIPGILIKPEKKD